MKKDKLAKFQFTLVCTVVTFSSVRLGLWVQTLPCWLNLEQLPKNLTIGSSSKVHNKVY